MARMMIELTPEVNRAFSAAVWVSSNPGALPQVRHGESVLWRTANECAPNGALHGLSPKRAIDRRALPLRDEFPKLRISFVWFVGLNYPQTRVPHRKRPCL